ncbi:MAG: hypothetical protein IPG04_33080 [Polyangiaceae bacterium]|jgi:hypothetical protein|nr:hypothetical protein [Polyangiaceae bacterium]
MPGPTSYLAPARRRALTTVAIGALLAAGAAALAAAPLEAAPEHGACDTPHPADGVHAAPQKRGRFEALDDVSLSSKVEERLNAIAEKFNKRTGKTFVVTSGTRDPESQAELIYSKLAAGEDLTKLYKDKSAVGELVKVFDAARSEKKTRASTVALLASAIRGQMKRGIYISAHLKAGAADVRSTTMSPSEKRLFAEIARDVGWSVIIEATPPHFHLQLE